MSPSMQMSWLALLIVYGVAGLGRDMHRTVDLHFLSR
jgi:hypothetical protein